MTPRTPPAPKRTCDECRYDGGMHFSDDGTRSWRCPNYVTAQIVEQAATLSAEAHERAFNEAKDILREFAEHCSELSGNTVRERMELAGVDKPVIGAAFNWAASKKATEHGPLIAPSGRMVQSTEATTRHRIIVWSSLIFRGAEGRTA